jgi:hypothetical protein
MKSSHSSGNIYWEWIREGGRGGRTDQARGVASGKLRQMASLFPLSRPHGVQRTNGGVSFFSA